MDTTITLTLIVEYDKSVKPTDAIEAAKDLTEKAREYGAIKKASLSLPSLIIDLEGKG